MLYLKNWINKYFGFTKREYNALLSLVFLLLVLSVLPYILNTFSSTSISSNAKEQVAIKSLSVANLQDEQKHYGLQNEMEDAEPATALSLFAFDPNVTSLSQWQKLGLSAKQAQAIINYVSKGGKFYKTEDLQKMYTISAEKYRQLAPYVRIAMPSASYAKSTYPEKSGYIKKAAVIIEINNADTLQLDQIRGIGASFAKRIVNYREKIGGFYKKEQLLEVYGLDSAKYHEIKDQITVNPNGIRKININTAEFADLKNNPYLKYKQINAIIEYRKQHGKYNNIDDLKKVLILSPQNISNLTPYLSF